MPSTLRTIRDFIRYAASEFNSAGLAFGHGFDNAIDEASYLVLHTLHLPPDLPPAYAAARLTRSERDRVLSVIRRRVLTRMPAAYLTGEAWFAGMSFKVTPSVLVPRSPIAELIAHRFQPWLGDAEPDRIVDLCTGSGCIAVALAVAFPDAQVDATDISDEALALAQENASDHGVDGRMRFFLADLFDGLEDERYQLIVSNPPYVSRAEYADLAPEFKHEPSLGLVSGADGLDIPLRILHDAPDHLDEGGLLVLEVGASDGALMDTLPDLPAHWAEFERGGSGVLLIDRESLVEHRASIAEALQGRER